MTRATDSQPGKHVVIVGGGLAGLAAAEALTRQDGFRTAGGRITILESTGRPGGMLGTIRDRGWLVERSADSFLAARPEGLQLAERLGLGGQLIGVDPRVRRALVWQQGGPRPAPPGFRLLAPAQLVPILTTPLLSLRGRLRLVAERFIAARPSTADESLESFAVRRLGREAFERLVQPLAAGIWTADPARLSMAAACPDFLAMERTAGSLWAGERARVRAAGITAASAGARYGQFVTFADGMETLPERLAMHLRDCGVAWLPTAVEKISRTADGLWQVHMASDTGRETITAAGLVLTPAAPVIARLLATVDPTLVAELAAISYAGSAIVSLGFRRTPDMHPLDAAGMVVPRTAGRRILAASFSSSKFPHRAPEGCVLVRVFLGGAVDPDTLRLPDQGLVDVARAELADMLRIRGEPLLARIDRWAAAMPQYHVGHVDRVAHIDALTARHRGLALAGGAYAGVGIPQVIASGAAAASRVTEALRPA
jgi:oxygen-dependent protoporphyrinogen oxidase